MDTIFALSSGAGKAGVAVIRVSGAAAFQAGKRLTGIDIPIRQPVLRKLWRADGGHLDTALILGFGEGASFTGEPVIELQVHGSVAIVQGILSELGQMSGLRLAEPGEFTRRALENERLDLTEVEGLADLIEAETEAQRRQALRVFSGALGRLTEKWREGLVRAAALLTATIDFADEDVPEDVSGEVAELLDDVAASMRAEERGAAVSERIREGFEVAIVGSPNVGKSTLLNLLAGREAALTSEIAGTTRDVIEVRLDLGGLPVTVLDTAGMRETEDPIERMGVARAVERAASADLRVFLLLPGEKGPCPGEEPGDIVLRGKADLDDADGVSGLTGQGVARLIDTIRDRLETRASGAGTAIRARQRMAIAEALQYVDAARANAAAGNARVEYAADDLRHALHALDALIGRVDVEQVLDVVFQSFCMGK